MASSDNDDNMCSDDDDYQQYDSDYSVDDDDDGALAEEADDAALRPKEQRYRVITEDDVRALQDDCTARVADLILLPRCFAAAVLRHCKWSPLAVEDAWYSDERRVRDAVGLPAGGAAVAANDRTLVCYICFDPHPPGAMRSAGCDHFYCRECWRGYVRAAVGDGARCLSIRCPDPSCSVAVLRDLVDDVADGADRRRYAEFAVRSYVEESKKVRWCPAAGCGLAAEYLDGERCREPLDVACACRHGFCLVCGEEAHRPVPCGTVREWLAKHSADAGNASWVLQHTKHCPECRRPIEKNDGCNHMTCKYPCNYQFCWVCLGPWKEHGREYYNCNRYSKDGDAARREQAKMSLDRYLHYYERWAVHDGSRRKALEDMAGFEAAEVSNDAGDLHVAPAQLRFLMDAYTQVIECRRMLRWTYAFGYYLEDAAKLRFFECLQGQAEESLERLHRCAEAERKELDEGLRDDAAYWQKLADLTLQARKYFGNMVKAFETGLNEVQATTATNADNAEIQT